MRVKVSPSAAGGTVQAPPSKSYTHRAVILGSLAEGETVIEDFLLSDDTRYTIEACRALGVRINSGGGLLRISGTGGIFPGKAEVRIHAGNSGSTLRMTAALAALAPSVVVFDGEPRLRERPVSDLVAALKASGVETRYLGKEGYPPVEVWGGRLRGGNIRVSGSEGSQHISGLLMAAPYAGETMTIRTTGRLRSRPYVDITLDAMRSFGVEVGRREYEVFEVKSGQKYRGRRYRVEGDYSSAAYLFAAAAVTGGVVSVSGLKPDSPQGDRRLLDILADMGCGVRFAGGKIEVSGGALRGVAVDMGDYPDIVQPLAVVAAFAAGETRIGNIAHLRLKETDRIAALAAELSKMGVRVEVGSDSMAIFGGGLRGASIDAHRDHRMAMSFAVAGLAAEGGTIIEGAEAVSKSYPGFFDDLARLGAEIEVMP